MYFTVYQTLSICTADYQKHLTGHFPAIYRIPKDTFSLASKYSAMLGGTVLLHHQWCLSCRQMRFDNLQYTSSTGRGEINSVGAITALDPLLPSLKNPGSRL
jgi:hypothetical protein